MDEDSSINIHAYDAIADVYGTADDGYQIWDIKCRAFVDQHIELVEPSAGVTAIDLGCGTGEYASLLLSKGYHVVAVDNSAGMIEVASQKLFPYRDRVTTMVSDILNLDFPDESFQVAISFGVVLNHIEDHDRLFAKLGDLITPGGLLMFDMGNIFSPANYLSHVFRMRDRSKLKRFGRLIKSHVRSLPYTDEFPYRLDAQEVHVRLTYLPIKKITELLENRGFEVIMIDGLHILPSPVAAFRGILTQIDANLGRRLHRFAGMQFILARKV